MNKIIYMITTLFYPSIGGVENHVYNLSKSFINKGYMVKIINPVINGETTVNILDGIEVHRIAVGNKQDENTYLSYKKKSNGNILGFYSGYQRKYFYNKFADEIYDYLINDLSKQNNIDFIIHQHDFISSIKLSKKLSKKYKVIFTNHTGEFLFLKKLPFNKILIKLLTDHFSYILAPSNELANFQGIRNDDTFSFLSNGVDVERFSPISYAGKKDLRVTKNIDTDKFVVFSPRRWAPTKGIIYLVKAIKEIDNDNILFLFGGNDYSDYPEYRDEILEFIKINNLENKIKLLGNIDYKDMDEYVKLCDVMVIPSLMEAISLSALESMSCGIPVVSTNVGGMPQIIKHSETGFLVNPKSEQELVDMINFLYKNKELVSKVGNNCRKFVEEEYSWKKISDITDIVYHQYLNKV